MTLTKGFLLPAFSVLLSAASCSDIPRTLYYYGGPAAAGAYNTVHVFLIGVDGWGSYSIPRADMPEVKKMMSRGSYTLNTMNVLPTASMPNWAAILYGTTPAFHGYTHNTVKPTFEPALLDEYGYVPNLPAFLKHRIPGCRTAVLSEYGDIIKVLPPQVLDRAEKISGSGNVVQYIGTIDPLKPSFTFIHFDEADGAGHRSGHNSSDYYAALRRIDAYIKDIVEAAANHLAAAGADIGTVFILCADHGGIFYLLNNDYTGIFYQHGGNTPEERQVPLVFYGRINGAPLKEGYGITGAVNTYDIAPTVAALFGVPPAEPWLGRPLREVLP